MNSMSVESPLGEYARMPTGRAMAASLVLRSFAGVGFWLLLKIRDFFCNQGRAEIKSGAYMPICEHFYFRTDAESWKKIDF